MGKKNNNQEEKKVSNEDKALDIIGTYQRSKDWKVIYGNILVLCTCQIGSKFLQRIFS